MFRSKLIAITLPAIALASAVPVFADTITQYEVRRTTNGVTNIVEPGVVEYRRFSSSAAPNIVETRTITNSVVAPRVIVPTANTVRLVETPVMAPVTERQVILHNTSPLMLERQVVQPVFIQRAPAPVVMETYSPPVVVEKRYSRHHHHRDRHLVDIGAPLIHLRAF
ncbi:MAG: hypothetical protein C0469_10470 [Cyanobacteria bacterium DS2.3.42]|nr:hypothetical protein [Cyanobacteria bacterium DS2.3.42]